MRDIKIENVSSYNVYQRIKRGLFGSAGLLDPTHPLNPNGMNIIAIIHDRATACEEYRVIQPLQELEMRGHNCFVMNAGYMRKRVEDKIDDTLGADLVLFNRIVAKEKDEWVFHTPVEVAKKNGAAAICDFDDNYKNDYRIVHDGVLPDLSYFSALTVTTPWLRQEYGGMNKHIYVLPNSLQQKRFEGFNRDIPELTIGLTGSITHKKDWEVVVLPLLEILSQNDNIRVFCSGYLPDGLKNHPKVLTPGILMPEWSPDGVTVHFAKYGWILKNIDILVIPVDPADKFNWSKSNLKAIEGQMAGCLVIATGDPLPIYKDAITDGKTGFLVPHTEEGFLFAIKRAIFSWSAMQEIRSKGQSSARQLWSAQVWATERERVYKTAIEREQRHTRQQTAGRR